MSTPLEDIIRARITREGGMSVADYMALCLAHPEHGYYMRRQPFGEEGDFITAPEISQLFGELLGIWAVTSWRQWGRPKRLHVVELGPGRGLLLQDLLRAAKVDRHFMPVLELHLVETSPSLRETQRETLEGARIPLHWHEDLPELPAGEAAIVLANEFYDALPVHHYELTSNGWRERLVVANADDTLSFAATGAPLDEVPSWARSLPPGSVIELSPERETHAERLATLLRDRPAATLVVDYGHARPGPGETLQAIMKHEKVDVFHRPGEADLTAHVDFDALGAALRRGGLRVAGVMPQGVFLMALGLRQRLQWLMNEADHDAGERLLAGAKRLVEPEQMGEMFKALGAHSEHARAPYPFAEERETGG